MNNTITLHPISAKEPGKSGNELSTTRREFLQGTAILTGTLATGSLLAVFTPTHTWAAEMSVLNEQEAQFILRLTQVIFPHKEMPDAINALAVKDIDAAAADETVAASFRDGMAKLDEAAGGDWFAASAEQQLEAVTANTDSALFSTVRGQCITSLYDNELAYQHFGYQGEAFSKGGYVNRGFNDLKWLPDPPASASPAVL
jgi:hypothetical protein